MVNPATTTSEKEYRQDAPELLQLILVQSSLLQRLSLQFREKAKSERYFRRLYAKDAAQKNTPTKKSIEPKTAHDIRASINAILGYSQVMKDALSENQRPSADLTADCVEQIISRCWRLLTLINSAFSPVPCNISAYGHHLVDNRGKGGADSHQKAGNIGISKEILNIGLDYNIELHRQLLEALKNAEQRYHSIMKVMIVREIDEFGTLIVQIGETFQSRAIKEWGLALRRHTANFDKNKIQQMMQWFPEMVQGVEKLRPGEADIRLIN